MTCVNPNSLMQNSFSDYALPVSSFLSLIPSNTDLVTVSIVVPFPEYCIVGIILMQPFEFDYFYLEICILSFLHVLSWLDSLFLFSTEIYIYIYFIKVYSHLFTHSPIGHLDCFHVLAIIKKVSINIHAQIFVWT